MYVAIVDYDKELNRCVCATLDDNLEKVLTICNTESFNVKGLSAKPINFSFSNKGEVVQTSGSFDRFKVTKNILLCVYKNKNKIVGYGALVYRGDAVNIVKIKSEELIDLENKSNGKFFQNAIWRKNTLNAYPGCEFVSFQIGTDKKKSSKNKSFKVKVIEDYVTKASLTELVESNESVNKETILSRWLIADDRVYKANKKYNNIEKKKFIKIISPIVGDKPARICADSVYGIDSNIDKITKQDKERMSNFTSSQLKEIKLAKHNGVSDTSIIENPKLSVQQMRTIWVASKNNAKVEAFNNPECRGMKFYASRLFTDEDVNNYKDFLKHPEFTDDKLYLLEYAKRQGVYSDDLLTKNVSKLNSDIELLIAQKDFEKEADKSMQNLDLSDLANNIYKELSLILGTD